MDELASLSLRDCMGVTGGGKSDLLSRYALVFGVKSEGRILGPGGAGGEKLTFFLVESMITSDLLPVGLVVAGLEKFPHIPDTDDLLLSCSLSTVARLFCCSTAD